MAKVTLTDLTSLSNDTSATNSINANFQTIEDYINDNVLSRDTGAETNIMLNALDMNSQNIINAAVVYCDDINVSGSGITTSVTAAAASAAAAAASASDAADDAAIAAAAEAAITPALALVDHIVEYTAASGSSFTPDMSEYANFHFTLTTGANTINNPDDEIVGQSGIFVLIQDGTGSGTVTWGTDFEFSGGTAPTLSTAASAVDIVPYYVYASGRILCGNVLASYS